MNASDMVKDKTGRDRETVSAIVNGDENAWRGFVDAHTDWVLYKSREWCKGHCQYPAGERLCGLLSLSLQRDGKTPASTLPECDDGLDTYIWIFEQLRKKIKKYTGKNGCLLSTYVWTILNSREFHIDWLRWKFGRAF
jgi:hypothetical protein